MTPFTQHAGVAMPLRRGNIDTDTIIPSGNAYRIEIGVGRRVVCSLAIQ